MSWDYLVESGIPGTVDTVIFIWVVHISTVVFQEQWQVILGSTNVFPNNEFDFILLCYKWVGTWLKDELNSK